MLLCIFVTFFLLKLTISFSNTQIIDAPISTNYPASKKHANDVDRNATIPFISEVIVESEAKRHRAYHKRENMDELFVPQVPLGEQMIHFSSNQTNCTQNLTNSTCTDDLPHAPTFQNFTLTKVIVLSAIAVLSFLGNVATLASIVRTGRQSTSTVYMLLVQLAIADLLVTLFCILTEALWSLTVQWYAGDAMCRMIKFMQMFALYLSTFILVLIGFDRLCAVRFPMRRAHAKNNVRKGICCVWALSAAFSLPQAMIFSVMRGPFIEDFYQCVTYAFYTAQWQEQLYTTLSLILMFILPLFILIVTYICTFVTIANSGQETMFSERVTRTAIEDARRKILHKAKIKSLMITVVIVLTFVVCWTPYYATMIIFIFLEPDDSLSQSLSTIFFFGSSTAMINPLIYGAFHLKRRRKPCKSSTSTVNNNSSSSRVENSLANTLRRSHHHQPLRKSREESMCLAWFPNGECGGPQKGTGDDGQTF